MRKAHHHFMMVIAVLILSVVYIPSDSVSVTGLSETPAYSPDARKLSTEDAAALQFFNWEDYIGEHTIEDFTKATGIPVSLTTFADSEELLGIIQSDFSRVDLAIVSGDTAREMVDAKLLAKVDYSKIPNFKYIDATYRHPPYDPGQQYTVPYLMGTTGFMINTKLILHYTKSWNMLWDERYKGKIGMLNNGWEVIAAALKKLGYSINTRNLGQIREAEQILLEQKPLVAGYLSPTKLIDMMVSEELWLAQSYSGDAMVAAGRNKDLVFVNPVEGGARWIDVFVISRMGKHRDEAHEFINYILTPKVMGRIASEMWYATPNGAATRFMSSDVLESDSIYPLPETLKKFEFFRENSDPQANRYEIRIWAELQGGG
jgi:spermidine/putrescine transport system substrate-binding protein